MKTNTFQAQFLWSLYLIVFLGTGVIFVALWQKDLDFTTFAPNTKLTNDSKNCTNDKKTNLEKISTANNIPPADCKACGDLINKVLKNFSSQWTKNEENHQALRSLLVTNCNGFQKAFVTQTNSPLGTTIAYDANKRDLRITKDLFNNFPKDVPFSDKVLNTCAVVGNGGILANSSCGEAIDSAQFVIRCNLPPLDKGYIKHIGNKTNLVTANPSIFVNKYQSLTKRRRAFVDDVGVYGDSLVFLPAFSYSFSTDISLRVHYTLEDFQSPMKAVFMNPDYLRSLDKFWRSQNVNVGKRMSSGFMMVSLALEICNNVDVFGFWPFDNHPYGFQPLTNHYYDNKKSKNNFHAMPSEFAHLIKLHNQGVLRLHLGQCRPQ